MLDPNKAKTPQKRPFPHPTSSICVFVMNLSTKARLGNPSLGFFLTSPMRKQPLKSSAWRYEARRLKCEKTAILAKSRNSKWPNLSIMKLFFFLYVFPGPFRCKLKPRIEKKKWAPILAISVCRISARDDGSTRGLRVN